MYRLTTSLPYLLNRVGVRLGALFSRRLEKHGVTLQMYRVLAGLAERPDQSLNEITAVVAGELSTMSRLIGSLVDKGLVSRVRVATDERTVRISLTSKGTRLADTLMKLAAHYDEVSSARVNAAELAHFKRILAQIYGTLDVLEAEQGADARSSVRTRRKGARVTGGAVPEAGVRVGRKAAINPEPTGRRGA